MKIIITLAIFFAALFKPLDLNAAEDYTVTRFDLYMIVDEENTFDITEQIEVYFDAPKHGIFRELPLKNEIIRSDGTKSINPARISNINVDDIHTVYDENGSKVIKIGDPNKTLRGGAAIYNQLYIPYWQGYRPWL